MSNSIRRGNQKASDFMTPFLVLAASVSPLQGSRLRWLRAKKGSFQRAYAKSHTLTDPQLLPVFHWLLQGCTRLDPPHPIVELTRVGCCFLFLLSVKAHHLIDIYRGFFRPSSDGFLGVVESTFRSIFCISFAYKYLYYNTYLCVKVRHVLETCQILSDRQQQQRGHLDTFHYF